MKKTHQYNHFEYGQSILLFQVNTNMSFDVVGSTALKQPRDILFRKVFSSKILTEHILSYIPIESLCFCVRVCQNWHLIIKYIVPIPLINLKLNKKKQKQHIIYYCSQQQRTLSIGELLYWLPGENQFPKTVLLKLRFSAGIPTFLQLLTSVPRGQLTRSPRVINGLSHYHLEHEQAQELIEKRKKTARNNTSFQMIDLNEILFVISGHWTPIFDRLKENETQFGMDESQFFHHSRCFSIVTNTYMTYDFISFNPESNHSIVNTMRSIIGQSMRTAKKFAIFAKANKKYINQTRPLIFKDNLEMLNFEMFVLVCYI